MSKVDHLVLNNKGLRRFSRLNLQDPVLAVGAKINGFYHSARTNDDAARLFTGNLLCKLQHLAPDILFYMPSGTLRANGRFGFLYHRGGMPDPYLYVSAYETTHQ